MHFVRVECVLCSIITSTCGGPPTRYGTNILRVTLREPVPCAGSVTVSSDHRLRRGVAVDGSSNGIFCARCGAMTTRQVLRLASLCTQPATWGRRVLAGLEQGKVFHQKRWIYVEIRPFESQALSDV